MTMTSSGDCILQRCEALIDKTDVLALDKAARPLMLGLIDLTAAYRELQIADRLTPLISPPRYG